MRNNSISSEQYEPFCDVSPIAHALGLESTAAISTTLLDTYGGPSNSPSRSEAAEELLLGTHFAVIGDIPAQVEKNDGLLTIHFRLYLVRRDFWRVEHVPVVARCKERNGVGSRSTTIARDCITELAYGGLIPHGLNEFPLAIKHASWERRAIGGRGETQSTP